MAASSTGSIRSCLRRQRPCSMSSPHIAEDRVRVAVLGSTGSIGRQALDVLDRLAERYEVRYLAGGSNTPLLAEQARRFRPQMVSLHDSVAAHYLETLIPEHVAVSYGPSALEWFARREDVDIVLVGTSG